MDLQEAILRDCPSNSRAYAAWLSYLDKLETKIRAGQSGQSANSVLLKLYEQAYELIEEDWEDESFLVICIRKDVLNVYQEPASVTRDQDFQTKMSILSCNARRNVKLLIAIAHYYDVFGQKQYAKQFLESKTQHSYMSSHVDLLLEVKRILDSGSTLAVLIGTFHYVPPCTDYLQLLKYISPNRPKTLRRRVTMRLRHLSPQAAGVLDNVTECGSSSDTTSVTSLDSLSRSHTTEVSTTDQHSRTSVGNGSLVPCLRQPLQDLSLFSNLEITSSKDGLNSKPSSHYPSTMTVGSASVSNTITSQQPKCSRHTQLSISTYLVSEVSIPPSECVGSDAVRIPPCMTGNEPNTNQPDQDQENCRSKKAADSVVINGKTYTMKGEIGRGGSSVVYAVEDAQSHHRLALKLVNLVGVSTDVVTAYCNEANMLQSLQDTDRVIRLLDCERTNTSLMLLMEQAEISFIDLLLSLRNRTTQSSTVETETIQTDTPEPTEDGGSVKYAVVTPALPLSTISFYWQEMLRCVQAIHARRIIHLDLKLHNFVVARGKLKLIDLGISQRLPDDMTRVGSVLNMGSLTYMSPELLEGASALSSSTSLFNCNSPAANERRKVGRKSDIWSLGVILYFIVYGRPPFPQASIQARMMAIFNPELTVKLPHFGSTSLHQALERCLVRDFTKRASLDELLSLSYQR